MRAISKAVFPAAGLGTRFLPATKAMPKEMLPLVDKPLIQYAMEEAEAIGIRDVIIVTGRGKTAIEDHFDLSIELDYHLRSKGKVELADELRDLAHRCNIAYIRQHEALGLGHAILQSKALVESEPFAVLLADDVILAEPSCLAQLRQVYEHTGETVIALMQVPIERTSAYGIAWGDPMPEACSDHPVIGFRGVVEKPDPGRAPSNLAVVGRYILHPDIFSDLSAIQPGTNGELQLTDAINRLCQRRPVYGVMFKGRRFDAGDKVGFLLAALEIALDRPDLATSLRQHIERLCMQWIDGR